MNKLRWYLRSLPLTRGELIRRACRKIKALPFELQYKIYQLLHPDYPWLTQDANSFLIHWLRPHMIGFEWGSGRSTIFFSARVSHLVSVEHDTSWFKNVDLILKKRHIKNVDYHLVLPLTEEEISSLNWSTAWPRYKLLKEPPRKPEFLNYFNSINDYPDNYFDFVLVDGRARVPCMINAMPKVKAGGLLILDNSDRTEYRSVFPLLTLWERISTTNHVWDTDIYIKPNE